MNNFLKGVKLLLSAYKFNLLPQYSSLIRQISARKIVFKKKVRITVDKGEMERFIKTQTPGCSGVWGSTLFTSHGKADINLAINKPNSVFPLSRDINKNWLLHIEPPSYIRKLGLDNEKLLEKFSKVFTSDPQLYERGGKFIASPPYVHWHIGSNAYIGQNGFKIDYDFLKNVPIPEKKWNLSILNSNINNLSGHKLRAEFITQLCQSGINFKLFGGSNWKKFNQYVDNAPEGKWAAFSPAKYVLVIENEIAPYYWSEKFTDAILSYAIPIYYGSPNISDYFPKGSFISFDITSENAIADLMTIINSDYYEQNLVNLLAARDLVMKRDNMFSFIDREINTYFKKWENEN